MDKTNRTEMHRTFLLEGLPEPLTRASAHIQIFDNYIANTRMRLRSVRDPQTKNWTWILQQRFPAAHDLSCVKVAEIYLNEAEYNRFLIFEGTEIRKNRYFHEYDGRMFAFDVYIGDLWGLHIARVVFETAGAMENFAPPPFAVFEITSDEFFLGENLVGKKFEDVQAEVAKIGSGLPTISEMPDE
jgi:CYTH domain-containing protein